MPVTLAIHGGAGSLTPGMLSPEEEILYTNGLKNALDRGYEILLSGGAAADAVVAAIVSLEDNPLFNAGRGSVFTKKGIHEMDACFMDGSTLGAGAIAGVRNVKNPILLAREVMLYSGHVFLSGEGAGEFAAQRGIEIVPDEYFFNKDRYSEWMNIRHTDFYMLDNKGSELKGETAPNPDHKFGTVGAVACDAQGNVAAGTSTGGMTNKRFGRIGDSPVVGAGTYANNATCAISCTGHGEYFIRGVVAHDISCLMEYKGMTLAEACDHVVMDKLKGIGAEGGIIAVDHDGNFHFSFNSKSMYRGMRNSEGQEIIAYYR